MSLSSPRVAVIVLAAGNGIRLGRGEPKAFVHVAGRPALARALESVFGMREPVQVIVTVPPNYVPVARELARRVAGSQQHPVTAIVGGASRQASVHAALGHLADSVEVVLVHDAARPLAPAMLFDSVAEEVALTGAGVVPGIPVADTIKRTDESGRIVETVDRSVLSAVQTPQGFPRDQLVAAHAAATREFTDDSALVADAGYPASIIAGDELAFKITTGWELRQAEQIVTGSAASAVRVGTGTDAHAYDESKELWLAGLHWPGEPGLKGHSDGDVIIHAICDALLSAAQLGDLGTLFGSADPEYANARSAVFLTETVRRARAHGFEVGNITVQVVGNRPIISPRRIEAETYLGSLVGASVSISATTTDALGFTGRGEGVAAVATALVHTRSPLDHPLD